MKTRKELNLEILRQLTHYVNMYPDIRFGQALVNMDIVQQPRVYDGDESVVLDPFYEEPLDMLKRMRAAKT